MSSRHRNLPFACLLTVVASTLVAPPPAEGIPAFARKYRFSCSTCHAPAPRLKDFGAEFAARGFRLEDPAQEPARETLDVGDPLLALPRSFPVAARVEGFAAWTEDAAAETDVEWPWVFKILSGAPISKKVSYYFYLILEKNEFEGLEDAYLQFNDVLGKGVHLLLGQFQVCDPLYKRELRLERADYEIYKVRPGHSNANLTYDRGVILTGQLPGKVDSTLQVVNGNGIPKGEFDQDDYKNVALYFGRGFGPAHVGLFGYTGKESDEAGLTNKMSYWGPNLTLGLGKWELNFQYLRREDDNPFFLDRPPADVVTEGGFAEIHWFPKGEDGRWVLSGLYGRVESDDPTAESESASLTLNYLLARNIRFLSEVQRDLVAEGSRASLGVVAAF